MALKTTAETKKFGATQIEFGYCYDEETPDNKVLVYKLNKDNKTIEFYPAPTSRLSFNKIDLIGFTNLPDPLNKKGYCRGNILYYLDANFKGQSIRKITLTKDGNCSVTTRKKAKYVTITIDTLRKLADELGSMKYFHNDEKATYVRKTLNKVIPDVVSIKEVKNPRYRVKYAVRLLSAQAADNYDKTDINNILEIIEKLLKSKYKDEVKKSDLFQSTKLRVDTFTLSNVIEEFEKKLQNHTTEAEWGKFLEKNLYLIDPKYIYSLPQLNVMLGTTRKVDFGLVDVMSYLDIYEIKKPETPLLDEKMDHGNFIWHKETIKALVQAEKYLELTRRKAPTLQEDIKREKKVDLGIISPRAYVIIGNSSQLDIKDKRDDFRLLKSQFKNIDIILYDELLERLKNQKMRYSAIA